MEDSTVMLTKEDAEAFGEYKRMKTLLKIREQIARLEMDVRSPSLTLSELKNECERAKRLNVHSVLVHSVYTSSAKRFLRGSDVKVCAVVGVGETNGKTLLCECKQAFKQGADELELFLTAYYFKNDKLSLCKRVLKKIAKLKKDRPVSVSYSESLTEEEEKTLQSTVKRSGIETLFLPFDLAKLEKEREKGEFMLKSTALSLEEARLLFAIGVERILTDRAEEIASGLLSEAENVF